MSTARLLAASALLFVLHAPARAGDLDPHLPADTTTYFTVNVRQVLDSRLVKKYALAPAREFLKEAGAEDVFKDLGFDPLKDVDRVIVAGPGGKDVDRGLLIVRGSFDTDKLTKTAEARPEVTKHNVPLGGGAKHLVYEFSTEGAELPLFFAFVSDKVVIASPGKDYVVESLKQARANKKVVLKDKATQQMIERLDDKQSLSLIVPGKGLADAVGQHLPRAFKGALDEVKVIGGGLTVSDEIKLDLAVSTSSDESARAFREKADRALKLALVPLSLVEDNKALGMVLEVVKSVRVGGRGKQVTLSAKLSADVVDDLFGKDD